MTQADYRQKPIVLDLFCKAGGCSRGYALAGFDVVGVDIEPQPRYPYRFVLGDALLVLQVLIAGGHITDNQGRRWGLGDFAFISASPPCQAYSVTVSLSNGNHPDLIEPVRELLIATGLPYVIENVPGAPLINPLLLCGSMFPGLRVYRHRLFETNPIIGFSPATCNHSFAMPASKGQYHTLDKQQFITCVGNNFKASHGRIAMQIDWMTRAEISQAIPPAYTEWIGRQIMGMVIA